MNSYTIRRILSSCLSILRYTVKFRRIPNIIHPHDLNEKILWMAINADDSEWSRLADKYEVRKYLKEAGLENMLVPLIGKWDNAEDVDFESLPSSFVMKTNHGCGDVFVVKGKNNCNCEALRHKIKHYLEKPFGFWTGEPHYLRIKPCIIVEEMLENTVTQSCSLVDYKFYCFGGEPECVLVCYDRKGLVANKIVYDLEWNRCLDKTHLRDDEIVKDIPKPKSFEQMIDACRVLGKQFPFVRIDFYDVNGKPYFGEMTFTPAAGRSTALSQKYLKYLGSKLLLE